MHWTSAPTYASNTKFKLRANNKRATLVIIFNNQFFFNSYFMVLHYSEQLKENHIKISGFFYPLIVVENRFFIIFK